MKNLKRLFLLGGLFLLTGTATNAELVNGVRQMPEPATTAWTVGSEDTPYYLYNTSAKMFFTQGNTWGTRGCIGPASTAVKVYCSESFEESGMYYLNDYVIVNNRLQWRMACGEAADNSVYTDQNSSWGRPQWVIVPTSGNGFRIQTSSPLDYENLTPMYMGRDDEVAQDFYNSSNHGQLLDGNKRFPVSVELTEGDGHHIDWAIVSAEDYEAIAAEMAA